LGLQSEILIEEVRASGAIPSWGTIIMAFADTVAEILDSIWTGQVITFILPVLTFFSRRARYVWTG
jgi:hypothetical protein